MVTMGCDDRQSHLFRFELATREWVALPQMPRQRWHPALVEMAQYLFTIGGIILPDEEVGAVDVFDLRAGRWESIHGLSGLSIPDMPEARMDPAACACAGRLYVLGGMQAGPTEVVECLDLCSKQWQRLPDMKDRFSATGTAITCIG